MNSLEDGSEGVASSHGRPCVSCRRRKVKCDKTRPCSNCTRSKQLCTYDSLDAGISIPSDSRNVNASVDGDIRERLARLEALMATMMVRDSNTAAAGSPEASGESLSELNQIGSSTVLLPTQTLSRQLQSAISPSCISAKPAPVGQIIFQEGYSAYFDAEFWPGLVTEVCRQALLDNSHY